jgi:hypothetical protein
MGTIAYHLQGRKIIPKRIPDTIFHKIAVEIGKCCDNNIELLISVTNRPHESQYIIITHRSNIIVQSTHT